MDNSQTTCFPFLSLVINMNVCLYINNSLFCSVQFEHLGIISVAKKKIYAIIFIIINFVEILT